MTIVNLKKKNLLLHIGLPKTGTTTLQNHFFPNYSGYGGSFHRLGPDAAAVQQNHPSLLRLMETYVRFSGDQPPSGSGLRDDLSRWVEELDFNETGLLIFSREGLSQWRRGHSTRWPVDYELPVAVGTHPITIFLSELRLILPQDVSLTTIITLRNQSDFLGSLAAQLGRERYFDSSRFEELVTIGDAFMDFNQIVRDLEDVSGAEDHCTLLFEDGLEINVSKIVDLIGPPDLETEFDPAGQIPADNKRRSGANSWVSQKSRFAILVRSVLLELSELSATAGGSPCCESYFDPHLP